MFPNLQYRDTANPSDSYCYVTPLNLAIVTVM